MPLITHEFKSPNELNEEFAKQILMILGEAIERNGKATLAVSGGSTPKPLFKALSEKDFAWNQVQVTLVDERWVSNDHNDSNTKLVHENLLVNYAKEAEFVSVTTTESDPVNAEQTISQRFDSMADAFDIIILGMGEDGHTASLFPCSEQIEAGLDLSRELSAIATAPTTAPHQRMSMSLAKIIKAKHVFLHLVGAKKRDVLEDAIQNFKEIEKPIKAVVSHTNVDLMWSP